MSSLLAFQSATAWLLTVGVVLLIIGLAARRVPDRFPQGIGRAVFWVGIVLLILAVVSFVLPYAVIFFGARPA